MVFRFLFCYIATKTIFLILTLQKLKALVLYIAPLCLLIVGCMDCMCMVSSPMQRQHREITLCSALSDSLACNYLG